MGWHYTLHRTDQWRGQSSDGAVCISLPSQLMVSHILPTPQTPFSSLAIKAEVRQTTSGCLNGSTYAPKSPRVILNNGWSVLSLSKDCCHVICLPIQPRAGRVKITENTISLQINNEIHEKISSFSLNWRTTSDSSRTCRLNRLFMHSSLF